MSKMMKLSNPAIDSLRIYIPLSWVSLTEQGYKNLYEKRLALTKEEIEKITSGEAFVEDFIKDDESNFKRIAYAPKELASQGISIKMMIVERRALPYLEDKDERSFSSLVILINSKLLKEDYFKGITKDTVKKIWEGLQLLGLFSFSFEAFLNSPVVDVDFKVDFENMPQKQFKEVIEYLNKMCKPVLIERGTKNLGIQYSYRKNAKNYISNPFIKLYHKTTELKYNSDVFANKFLNLKGKNIVRIEGTVKNKKHFKSLKLDDNTLGEVLDYFDDKKIIKLLSDFLYKYMKTFKYVEEALLNMGDDKESVISKNMGYSMSVKMMILQGRDLKDIENTIKENLETHHYSRMSIYRKLQIVRKIYAYLIDNDKAVREKVKKSKIVFQFLSLLQS
jgi:hypothetical protein